MTIATDEDRTALTDTVTRFARTEIAPHVDAWDAAGEFPRTLYRRVRYEARTQLNLGRFLVCLDVFSEFAIFSYTLSGPEISIRLNQCSGKADINGSGIIHGLLEIAKG